MKKFSIWLENQQKDLWIDLYLHLLEADNLTNQGVFNDKDYHNNLIKKLRILGLGEQANELEMVRMSQDDIAFSKAQHADSKQRMDFRVAYNTYMDHIEHLTELVYNKIKQNGWQQETELKFNQKFPQLNSDRDFYDLM